MAQVAAALHELQRIGELSRDIRHVATSYAHMHVNRLMQSDPNAHELVMYDFLARYCKGKMARR